MGIYVYTLLTLRGDVQNTPQKGFIYMYWCFDETIEDMGLVDPEM